MSCTNKTPTVVHDGYTTVEQTEITAFRGDFRSIGCIHSHGVSPYPQQHLDEDFIPYLRLQTQFR